MHTTTAALPTFDALARFVKATLCDRDGLDPDTTPFVQTPIRRRDELWGYAFHVEGPRQLRTSAVWSATDAAILFYNSVGKKVHRVELRTGPPRPVSPARQGFGGPAPRPAVRPLAKSATTLMKNRLAATSAG